MRNRRAILKAGLALAAALFAIPSLAPLAPAGAEPPTSLDILIPANPGGGWDQTGRALEQAMKAEGLVE